MPTATGARTSTPSKKTGPGRRRARSVPGNPAAGSMSARRRKAREKAAAPAWELWCHSRRTVPAGEEQSARPTDVSGQTAPRSVRPERKRAERVSQTTHSERSPKTRRIDAGATVSFDVRTKKRLTAEPPPNHRRMQPSRVARRPFGKQRKYDPERPTRTERGPENTTAPQNFNRKKGGRTIGRPPFRFVFGSDTERYPGIVFVLHTGKNRSPARPILPPAAFFRPQKRFLRRATYP